MKNFKKTMITVGSLAAGISPVAAVVACGTPGTEMGDAEFKFLAFIKSKKGIEILDSMWTDRVLENISTNADEYPLLDQTNNGDAAAKLLAWRKELTRDFLSEMVSVNPNYLITLANQINGIAKNNKIKTLLNDSGFNKSYLTSSYEDNNAKSIFEAGKSEEFNIIFEILNTLPVSKTNAKYGTTKDTPKKNSNIKYKKLGFATRINNLIITKAYMSIDKTQWASVFSADKIDEDNDDDKTHTQTLTPIQEEIAEGKNFILNKFALEKKYSFQWSVNLTKDEDTSPFRLKNTGIAMSDAINELKDTKDKIGSKAQYEEKFKKINHSWNVFDSKNVTATNTNPTQTALAGFKEMIGFKGLVALSSGTGHLDYSFSELTKPLDKARDNDFGFIQKGDIVQDGIKYFDDKSNTPLTAPVGMTAVVGILPRANRDGKLQLNIDDQQISVAAATATTKAVIASPAFKSKIQFDLDKLSTMFAIKDQGLYAESIKYFSNRTGIGKDAAIKVKIHDKYILDILKEIGLGYVEYEKNK